MKTHIYPLIALFCLLTSIFCSPQTTFAAGSIVAWGDNYYGQCNIPEPNSGFIAIAAEYTRSLGLKQDGSIVAWGNNYSGLCNIPSPNSGFIAIAAGEFHSLGLKQDGSIVAWGDNDYGQCNVPSPNSGFIAIAAGELHSLGLKQDGSIVAWGAGQPGQSGWPHYGQCDIPSPNSGFIAIAAGDDYSLGLKQDGSIVAWGDNGYGQCNIPSPNDDFIAISAGYYLSLGLKNDGSIVAWGKNSEGECNIPSPNTGFIAIAAGYAPLGLKQDGSIVAWGRNDSGQCNIPSPNSGFIAIETCNGHSLAIVEIGPELTLMAPNGGEVLIGGSTYTIIWSSTGSISDVIIEYSIDNGSNWTPVDPPNAGNTGSYDWLVPAVNSNQCLVRISDASNPNINDTSDAVFTIGTPVLFVVDLGTPAGEAGYTLADWGPVEPLTNGGNWGGLATDPQSYDKLCRTVWSTANTSSAYIIFSQQILAVEIRHLDSVADESFEVYVDGMRWGSYADAGSDEVWKITLFSGTPSDYYPQCLEIRATGASWSGFYPYGQLGIDWVKAEPGPETILLLTPNGGETLTAGATYPITWSSTGSISDVLIEYSIDNGSNWTPVDPPNAGNTGSYDWVLLAVNSNQCLVRISDASNPSISDTSDSVFTITTLVAVPDVVGLNQTDAESTIISVGLTVGDITHVYSDTVPAGIVISQNPTAGIQVPLGSSVDLVISLGKLIKLEMALIPGGTFQMGDSKGDGYSDELPVHTVTLDSFYMGKYEITNLQYCQYLNSALGSSIYVSVDLVYGSENNQPYCDTHSYSSFSQIDYSGGVFSVRTKGGRNMSNDPMVMVSWYGAAAYCNWRSQQEGKEPCYNLATWECDFSKHGYRLPTEAEWEYAARGGLSGKRFPWGDTISHSQANYCSYWEGGHPYYPYDISPTEGYHPTWNDGIHPYTASVGSFQANGYGLYDMAGNVYEWCNDWYDGNYYASRPDPDVNPIGPISGSYRVLRGGCYVEAAYHCRVARRDYHILGPDIRSYALGLRVVLAADIQPDLEITSEDISFGVVPGVPGEPNTVSVTVRNIGRVAAENVNIVFKDFDEIIGSQVISSILPHDSNTVSIQHTWPKAGFQLITVTADPYNEINESDETNNSASKLYQVGDVGDMNATIEISSNPPPTFIQGSTANIGGEAFYKIKIPGKLDYVYPVRGGSVSTTITYAGQDTNLPTSFTDTQGCFNISFAVPGQAGDVFDVNIAVTDVTLTGRWERSFNVTSPPEPKPKRDLYVEDIIFSGSDPNITIQAIVYANPDNNATDYNVPVSFYRYPPQQGIQIGATQDINEIPPGANKPASVTWNNAPNGIHCIKAELGTGFSDDNNGNNYATRPLVVGPAPTNINVVIETPLEGADVNASDTTPVTVYVTDNNGNVTIPCVLQTLTLDFNGVQIWQVDLKPYFDWDSSRYIYPWQPPTSANGQACMKVTAQTVDILGNLAGSDSVCVNVGDNAPPDFSISASPYWARIDQSVWVTVDSSELLLNDQLDSNTITDNDVQPIQFSLVSHDPNSTRWTYQTVALPQTTALGRATITVQGTDLHGNTCSGQRYFYVVEDVPDFWIYSEDITFSNDNPDLGEIITINAVIHASPDNTISASDIPVTLYARHPAGDYQIGETQYTGEILPGGTSEPVDVNWTNAARGWYIIETELGPDFSDRNYINNKATRSLVVGTECDFDCNGKVNFEDLARLADLWLWIGPAGTIPEDLIQDGTVNFPDFAICAENWFKGVEP